METKRLEQFQVIAKTSNLREAASLIGISHPGLSKSIRVLEDELGVSLLTKEGRGIKITPLGRQLLNDIERCILAERQLMLSARGIRDSHLTQIRIGTFEVFSTYLSSSLVQAFGAKRRIIFEELIPGELEHSIARGETDFGITYIPVPHADVEHIEITRVKMGMFANSRKLPVPLDLQEIPFVAPLARVEGSPTKVKGLDGWPDDRLPRNIRYSVTLMETALELIRTGSAVGYLPLFVVQLHNERVKEKFRLQELPIPKWVSKQQPVFAAKSKSRNEDDGFRFLCRVLRTLR